VRHSTLEEGRDLAELAVRLALEPAFSMIPATWFAIV